MNSESSGRGLWPACLLLPVWMRARVCFYVDTLFFNVDRCGSIKGRCEEWVGCGGLEGFYVDNQVETRGKHVGLGVLR